MDNKDIDFIYNLYVLAIIELAKVKPIKEVGIFEKSPFNPKLDTNNPYIKGNWLKELGESVLANGTHWVYICRHKKFLSGNHRIMSLRKLSEEGIIPHNHKVLCIDIGIDSTFSKTLSITTLRAKEIKDLKIYGLETITVGCSNYRSWIETILRVPKMMKEILFEYKQETGKEYKTLSVINQFNELKQRCKNGF